MVVDRAIIHILMEYSVSEIAGLCPNSNLAS